MLHEEHQFGWLSMAIDLASQLIIQLCLLLEVLCY